MVFTKGGCRESLASSAQLSKEKVVWQDDLPPDGRGANGITNGINHRFKSCLHCYTIPSCLWRAKGNFW